MICPKCGAQLPDDSVFCATCGANLSETPAPEVQNVPVQNVNTEPAPAEPFTQPVEPFAQPVEPPVQQGGFAPAPAPVAAAGTVASSNPVTDFFKKVDFKNFDIKNTANLVVIIIAVVALIICGSIIGKVANGKPAVKRSVNSYVTAIEKGNYKKIKSLTPEKQLEDMEDWIDDSEEYDDVDEYFEEEFSELPDYWEDEYGDNIKIKVEFNNVKIYKTKNLKSSTIEDDFDVDEFSKSELKGLKKYKKVAIADVTVTIEGDDDDDESDTMIYLVREGGKWKIYSGLYV
ncbi:MAG: zinc ribbon domain-containing protein [Ruminococcaceae bacterium]|nr:zinc ribbon domain-containing protein [Oscillospiraceae bacterium]